MPHENWRGAVTDIRETTGPVTTRQRQLATVAGIELPENLPQLVAKVRLRAALGSELGLPAVSDGSCSDAQRDLISRLETEGGPIFLPLNWQEASAWIYCLSLKQRQQALEQLRVEAGDIVKVGPDATHINEVSSIGSDGRIYFKGGAGAGAWPDTVVVICRKHDDTAAAREYRREAANRAALRPHASNRWWSDSKQRVLEKFEVQSSLISYDVEQLKKVIQSAKDEKPIQEFLETQPQILTALLGGRHRFFLPRVSLGDKYVADFFIADTDSLGIRWVLVELETPESSVTLQNSNELGQSARKGVSQIRGWREWLQHHIAYAREEREKGGLGLVDIRPRSEGLVLVGRRARLRDNAVIVRNPIREDSNIRVHTYDWLIEQLNGILTFNGPPAADRFLLRPLRD